MNKNILEFLITEDEVGTRLDKILSQKPEFHSRSGVTKLFELGKVKLKDKTVKASYKPSLGEVIRVDFLDLNIDLENAVLEPYEFPIEIIYEDEHLIVVNKPAGLVVHPSHGHQSDSLVNALIGSNVNLSSGFQSSRPGIVHRIDKDTSGLLVVAKTNSSHAHLAKQFKNKTVHRIYEAIIFGQLKNNIGKIETFLARHPKDRKKFASLNSSNLEVEKGKRAITHFKKIGSSTSGFSKIQCRLETGRTHQIRIHLSEMGHPIIGDELYGSMGKLNAVKSKSIKDKLVNLNRIGLHAKELGFVHPVTSQFLVFKKDWPHEMLELFKLMKVENV